MDCTKKGYHNDQYCNLFQAKDTTMPPGAKDWKPPKPVPFEDFKCPAGLYTCRNKECTRPLARCDGRKDCSDGSDEMDCTKKELKTAAKWKAKMTSRKQPKQPEPEAQYTLHSAKDMHTNPRGTPLNFKGHKPKPKAKAKASSKAPPRFKPPEKAKPTKKPKKPKKKTTTTTRATPTTRSGVKDDL